MSVEITGKSTSSNFITLLSARDLTLTVDEPLEKGGQNTAMTPMELIAGALSSCTIITLQMYFNHKGWNYNTIEVAVDFDNTITPIIFNRIIKVSTSINDKEFSRIEKIANACPVHKLLENGNKIITSIIRS
ncbi:OsmC family protein [Faecalibacter rhinopitheci]|uniref:OsmC family protein n=1 Tax=Faecalibacter rhinopitheci TaxID=2779678 RepID=A0A8J7FKE2_9FLAO|nr:OsmC family protein [Faecalibacter rhinopitheci]MBF0595897.1 OsmC family protein [Faecalibacter rhinopitheci]